MKDSWKTACAGALGGAALGMILVFAAAWLGYLPVAGARIHDYLMAHPDLIQEMSDRYQDMQQTQDDRIRNRAVEKMGLKPFFNPAIAFVTGPADAKKTLVEFYDYDCPYCRGSLPALKSYYEAHKNDTRFSFIEFPLPALHGPGATLAARASLAARRQPDKFLDFYFTLMAEQGELNEPAILADARKVGLDVARLQADMQNPEIDAVIAASHRLADKAHINGTPTFIANDRPYPGLVDDQALAAMMQGG